MIQTLINTSDGFEIVRAKIISILTTEIASQKALAVAAGEDSDLWNVRIFAESNNPFEVFLNNTASSDNSPLCNVNWYDSDNDPSSGNLVSEQAEMSKFWLDCYGYGRAASTDAGHLPGDVSAAYEASRAARLVRGILMAGEYIHLGLRPLVASRRVRRRSSNKPQSGDEAIQNICMYRLEFEVRHSEVAPQVAETILQEIHGTFTRAEDGEVIATVEYDYT
jgi:hypothetical protein